jgi:hypothetical protein
LVGLKLIEFLIKNVYILQHRNQLQAIPLENEVSENER